jgi:hypothetical protein
MNFSDILTEVYDKTKRPDLVDRTKSAIKSSTIALHSSDFYAKDLIESGIQFPTSDYLQQFDCNVVFPRWRKAKYLRTFDISSNTPGVFLTRIEPDQLFDSYGRNKTDCYYQAGANLNIKTSSSIQYCLVGYYTHPDISELGYDSWIAQEYPWAIIYSAAAEICRHIGKKEAAQGFRADADTHKFALQTTNIPSGDS